MCSIYKKMLFNSYVNSNCGNNHKFHMVISSPWPVLTSFGVLLLILNFVFVLHNNTFWATFMLFLTLLVVIFSMFLWFSDVMSESVYMGCHTSSVKKGLRMGFMLFLVSEVMFFFSFFWAYFHVSLVPNIFIGGSWPPMGVVYFFISQDFDFFLMDKYYFLGILSSYFNELKGLFFSVFPYLSFEYYFPYDIVDFYDYHSEVCLLNDYFEMLLVDSILFNDIMKNYSLFMMSFYNDIAVMGDDDIDNIIVASEFVFYSLDLDGENMFKVISSMFISDYFKDNFVWFFDFFSMSDNVMENFFPIKQICIYFTPSFFEFYNLFLGKGFSDPFFHVDLFTNGLLMDPYSVPLLNTIVLLVSGCTLTSSHMSLKLSNYYDSMQCLIVSMWLGIFFFFCQISEYKHAFFSIKDGMYGTTFFMLTGFHGFHVFMGTVFLLVCFFSFVKFHFTNYYHFCYEAAMWYWHFVDVVWMFLYFFVYLWPSVYFFMDHNFVGNEDLNGYYITMLDYISSGGFNDVGLTCSNDEYFKYDVLNDVLSSVFESNMVDNVENYNYYWNFIM